MKNSPHNLVLAVTAAGLLFVGGTAYLVFRTSADFRGFVNERASAGVAVENAKNVPQAAAAASSTVQEDLVFNFKDPKIVERIEDDRSRSYSFLFDKQTIGVLLLSPSGKNGPENFEKWSAGIKDTLALDGENVPVTHQKISGREALTFEIDKGAEKSWNIMVEVDGRVLWLQSRTGREVLAKFLENLSGLK